MTLNDFQSVASHWLDHSAFAQMMQGMNDLSNIVARKVVP
jgi:hypothetical protein